MKREFALGFVVATPNALETIHREDMHLALQRWATARIDAIQARPRSQGLGGVGPCREIRRGTLSFELAVRMRR